MSTTKSKTTSAEAELMPAQTPEPTQGIVVAQPQQLAVPMSAIPQFDFGALFQLAIEKNNIDVIERMMAVRRELEADYAKKAFQQAMAAFQRDCPSVAKSRPVNNAESKGGGHRYNFAPLEDIVRQVGSLIAEHGFTYTWNSTTVGNEITVHCIVTHSLGHREITDFKSTCDAPPGANRQQGAGSGFSYGKRYSFIGAFGIVLVDEDDDANSTVEDRSKRAELARKREMRQAIIHNDPSDDGRPLTTDVESTITDQINLFMERVGAAESPEQMRDLWKEATDMLDPSAKSIAKKVVTARVIKLNLQWDGKAATFVPKPQSPQ
jgi:hypothetical protein